MRMLDEVWKQALWRADKSVAAGADAGKLLARFALFLSDSKEATGQPADTRIVKAGMEAVACVGTARNVSQRCTSQDQMQLPCRSLHWLHMSISNKRG